MDCGSAMSDKEKWLLKKRQQMEAELAKLDDAMTGIENLSSNDDLLKGMSDDKWKEEAEMRVV